MIHSMSGGVLADGTVYTFAKVETAEGPHWFLAPMPVEAGDTVLVPLGTGSCEGTVLRTELCTRQTAPCPFRHAREIWKVCKKS